MEWLFALLLTLVTGTDQVLGSDEATFPNTDGGTVSAMVADGGGGMPPPRP